MPPEQISSQVGLAPDESATRGERRPEQAGRRPVPRLHSWVVGCRERGLRIDAQIGCIVQRLQPCREAIGVLARAITDQEEDGGARLVVVRYLDDPDEGAAERMSPPDARFQHVGHPLLGFVLDTDVLQFLTSVEAHIWFDEYP